MGGLDDEARAALLARQAAGMDLEEAEGELGEVRLSVPHGRRWDIGG